VTDNYISLFSLNPSFPDFLSLLTLQVFESIRNSDLKLLKGFGVRKKKRHFKIVFETPFKGLKARITF